MNKRELVAQLAPYPDDAELLVCVHRERLSVCGECRAPNPQVTRQRGTGNAVLHLELWPELQSSMKLRLVKGDDDGEK